MPTNGSQQNDHSPANILKAVRENTANPKMKNALAKGLVPLDPKMLGEILLILSADSDTPIRETARKTLSTIPESILHVIAENQNMDSKLLDIMAKIFSDDPEILPRLALNSSTTNETIDYIASLGFEKVLDIIAVNQARMISFPKILDTLLANPQLTRSTRLKLQTYKAELIEQGLLKGAVKPGVKGKAAVAAGDEETEDGFQDLDEEEYEDEFEEEYGDEFEEEEDEGYPDEYDTEWERETYETALEEVTEEEDTEHLSVAQRIQKLTVAEKVVLARMANKEERTILIRDSNKQVALAVLKSPKITDGEAEMIARMRNVPDEVLREVANNRDWTKNNNVVVALVNNPKTPVGLAVQFISRMQNRDLRDISMNRNVSETVRTAAKRLLTNRQRATGLRKKSH